MKKILYLSPVDWFWIKQRPQHFCENLSLDNSLTFFCLKSWGKEDLDYSDNEQGKENNEFLINPNLKVIRKRIFPFQAKISAIKKLNRALLRRYIQKLNDEYTYDVVIVTNPEDIEIIPNEVLESAIIIYDCMDNYKKFPGKNASDVMKNESKLLAYSDLITVSSDDLFNEIKNYGNQHVGKTYVLNNGVDIGNFDISVYPSKTEKNKNVGYIGTISEWVDIDLVKKYADKHPQVDFYFYGPLDSKISVQDYSDSVNIHFEGVLPYNQVPPILSRLDVAIMPFKITDLVKSVNPVKIYEYLAMGKKVLACDYSETRKFGSLISIYANETEFEAKLTELLGTNQHREEVMEKVEFAHKNSWKARVEKLEELIADVKKDED